MKKHSRQCHTWGRRRPGQGAGWVPWCVSHYLPSCTCILSRRCSSSCRPTDVHSYARPSDSTYFTNCHWPVNNQVPCEGFFQSHAVLNQGCYSRWVFHDHAIQF